MYDNSCSVDLTDILLDLHLPGGESLVYEPFIQQNLYSLYPVPVKISNMDINVRNPDPNASGYT